jgi:hypothetical protein
MIDLSSIDYSAFDRPEILNFLFYPRGEFGGGPGGAYSEMLIPVEKDIHVGARLYRADGSAPVILFFHGNGEIAADYHDLGPVYNQAGAGFLPVDYRGYGRSTGRPTVTGMMRDCHVVFEFVRKFLSGENMRGPLAVMGRSLGSASALELACHYPGEIAALIIESGFAYIMPLLALLGVDAASLGIDEERGFENITKIKAYAGPTLVIHAERDHIIPYSDGTALYEACGARDKRFLGIKKANHNNIFQYGFREYMQAVQALLSGLKRAS